jgi:hypothetical protein
MKIIISEEQLQKLTKKLKDEEVTEQEGGGSSPEDAAPTSGTSDTQSGGSGYPEVDKWESDIKRGPANTIDDKVKWSDVEGTQPARSHANPLR